jgi:hypothetical protein
MKDTVAYLWTRAKYYFKTEGLKALIRRGAIFIGYAFYQHRAYYLYEHTLKERDEADFRPKTKDFTYKTLSTNKEVDGLIASGFEFASELPLTRQVLAKGAISSCIFIGRELAAIGFVAATQEGMDALLQPPYKVHFSEGEACTGGGWTNPKYRVLGLGTYIYFKRLQLLKEKGKVIARAAVSIDNIASQKLHAKFGPKIWAEGHIYKVLWYTHWKEKAMKHQI